VKQITILFVKRRWWNVVAALIRWAIPLSRFKLAKASHSMIVDNDDVIHATMLHGVIRQPRDEALKGQSIVETVSYAVPDGAAGIEWANSQIGKSYDFLGAFGLGLSPGRRWQEDDKWFCHELCAAAIQHSGRELFVDSGHVTDSHLLIIKP
jgi:uncharacterized protein YycO